jgi:predicted  nucleic acid-binding Zn-ribbon protein
MTTFICSGGSSAELLQWQDNNGYLSGSYEYSSISGQAPQEQVSSNSGGLSGTLNGNAISLTIGLQQPLYGTLDGSQLTLNVPQSDGSFQAGTCNSGSLSDWNSAVQALDSQVTSDNSTALQQQAQASSAAAQQEHVQQVSNAQQSLSNDVSTLQSDSSSLNSNTQLASDINQMKTDYQTEQNDWQTAQTQGSCSDGSLGSDVATVSSDSATVDSDLASLQSDVTSIQDSLSGIQTDISNVNSDLSTLQNLGATPGIDASGALAAGQKAISNANAAIQWANGQGNGIDGQAHQLATTAQNYESSKGC